MSENIYKDIAALFWERVYLLKKDGFDISPDENDIERLVDGAIGMLYDGEEGQTVTVGKMMIRKNHRNRYDVFVWMGEVE